MYRRPKTRTLKTESGGTFIIFLVFMIVFFPFRSNCQTSNDVDPEIAGIEKILAPVKIDGKTLFFVRGISSYPAGQRASAISKRIRKAAANNAIPADSVKITNGPGYLMIYAGEDFIMNIYDVDAESEKINQTALARLIQVKTIETLRQYREHRSSPVLFKNSIHAIGAVILYVAFLYCILWLLRKIKTWLQIRIKSKADSLENKSYKLISSVQIWMVYNSIFRILKFLTVLILSITFLEYIFGLFPWTNSILISTLNLIVDPLKTMSLGIIGYIPSLFFLIVIFLVTRYLLKLIKLFFNGINQGMIEIHNFPPEWALPTFRIVKIFITAFAVIIAYPYIPGSSSAAFKGVSVFLGLLISIGSSSLIGNIMAGYSMTYRRAFRKGDLIQVNDIIGVVDDQKLMVTRLRSYKNEEIVIPNSVLQSSNIINFSSKAGEKGLILHSIVGIGYETPWRQVDSMLKLAADRTEGLLKQPPPFVLKRSLGDFAVNYEINAYCKDVYNMLHHYNELHQNILDVFNENNVQIMTPAYERDPEEPKVVPKDKWDIPLSDEKKT
jgi:small-conductance mechanosensitive channel